MSIFIWTRTFSMQFVYMAHGSKFFCLLTFLFADFNLEKILWCAIMRIVYVLFVCEWISIIRSHLACLTWKNARRSYQLRQNRRRKTIELKFDTNRCIRTKIGSNLKSWVSQPIFLDRRIQNSNTRLIDQREILMELICHRMTLRMTSTRTYYETSRFQHNMSIVNQVIQFYMGTAQKVGSSIWTIFDNTRSSEFWLKWHLLPSKGSWISDTTPPLVRQNVWRSFQKCMKRKRLSEPPPPYRACVIC